MKKSFEDVLAQLMPDPAYTGPEAAKASGVPHELAHQIWRALGMPHVEDETVAFSERDVAALRVVAAILSTGVPEENVLSIARLLGRAMSRISDAQLRGMVERVHEGGGNYGDLANRVQSMVELMIPILDYTYRRHLYAALQQLPAEDSDEHQRMAAGFADLVGFSRVSDDLPDRELADLIAAFDELAVQSCADFGVRLVKIVGDAAMFVSPSANAAVQAARAIVERVDEHGGLPKARAGLDFGPVLAVGGDYFGRPVNVAARIQSQARSGTVVFSQTLRDELQDVTASRIGPRRLKNVGLVTLYKLKTGAGRKESANPANGAS